jgi:hypothetical protein
MAQVDTVSNLRTYPIPIQQRVQGEGLRRYRDVGLHFVRRDCQLGDDSAEEAARCDIQVEVKENSHRE